MPRPGYKRHPDETDIPEGFEMGELTSDIWRVGHIFRWSPVFEGYLKTGGMISVRPGEVPGAAYCRETDEDMSKFVDVFFVKEYCK